VAPAGHRVAIGDVVYDPAVVDVVDLDVSLHDPSVPRPAPPPGELTTDDVETTTDEVDTRVTFTVSSTFGERVDGAVATAVLRDEEGAIIGGAMTVLGPVPTEGQARARIDAFSPVPGVDP